MSNQGSVEVNIENNLGCITFFHPKKNSLPKELLDKLATAINQLSDNKDIRVIVLKSKGNVFCAGASFDELLAITNEEESFNFFFGFVKVMLAIKNSPKIVVAKVQGKAVGGGVGIIAACDYVYALNSAALKLSEILLGIGPFMISSVVERKIGRGALSKIALDANWYDANWAVNNNLFSKIFSNEDELNIDMNKDLEKFIGYNPESVKRLKEVFWSGYEDLEETLNNRCKIVSALAFSPFVQNKINQIKSKVN